MLGSAAGTSIVIHLPCTQAASSYCRPWKLLPRAPPPFYTHPTTCLPIWTPTILRVPSPLTPLSFFYFPASFSQYKNPVKLSIQIQRIFGQLLPFLSVSPPARTHCFCVTVRRLVSTSLFSLSHIRYAIFVDALTRPTKPLAFPSKSYRDLFFSQPARVQGTHL